MSNHAQDPQDRIFGDDDLLKQLCRRKAQLLDQIEQELGKEARDTLRTQGRGAASSSPLVAEYLRLNAEITRRNSRRCSQQMSRFLAGINGDDDLTDAGIRWWLNRY